MSSTQNCTSVSANCPVEATVYGYYPNLPANVILAVIFALFHFANILLGLKFKTWSFSALLALGCIGEAAGYIGRIILHSNPWSNAGFELQICTLIFSPSWLAAAIYVLLKHIILAIGPNFSPIKASLYPYIFVICDLLSLFLQALGGGVAASAATASGKASGGKIMLAGIIFQVLTFVFLFVLAAIFAWNVRRNLSIIGPNARYLLYSREFRIFLTGLGIGTMAIFIRCVYRIAELAGGWANSVMRDEVGFIILDGGMCVAAVLSLTLAHPGIFFKDMGKVKTIEEKHGERGTEFEFRAPNWR
ncbi:RTA1 like protein-domain-containing protein [Halenospora varia]|nr:RTA1 like protein-domain-containing protein [Halenospora varia]